MEYNLEELKRQKKEIEEKIRILQNEETETERVRFGKEHYPTNKPDEYYIQYKARKIGTGSREGYLSLIRATKKEQAFLALDAVIEDLEEMRSLLKEEYNM